MYRYRRRYNALALVLILPFLHADFATAGSGDAAKHNFAELVDERSPEAETASVAVEADETNMRVSESPRQSKEGDLLLASNAVPALARLFPQSAAGDKAVATDMVSVSAGAPAGLQAVLIQDPFPGPFAVAALSLAGFLLAGIGVVIRDVKRRREIPQE